MNNVRPLIELGTICLDRYRIDAVIGQGGMQQVFRAHDLALDRIVALKTPLNHSGKIRFARSARLSAKVSHPNVAHTLDYSKDDDLEFLVEEYIEGENLQERLNRDHDLLDPYLAVHIVHHVTKAVRALNKVGIIHRDLKPSNIMVSKDPGISTIKVTDFGIAKLAEEMVDAIDPSQPSSVTASKTLVGALPYMAPELLRKKRYPDKTKADVWSIGALLYKFLFRDPPFTGEIMDVMLSLSNAEYIDRNNFIKSTPFEFRNILNELWKIIEQCLVVDVDKRLDANELAKCLEGICYNIDHREFGAVTYINPPPKKIGLITSLSGKSIFFNFQYFYPGDLPKNGDRVLYSKYPGSPNPRAFPVLKCKPL